MTGLAGLVRAAGDGRDDLDVVRRMLHRLTPAASGVVGEVVDSEGAVCGAVGVPLTVSRVSGLVVGWDGRLDNPQDLSSDGPATSRSRASDADRVARYWDGLPQVRADHVAGILGDFALAVWSPRHRRLWLARDALGIRPLFYAWNRDVCWWASSLDAVLEPGWLPREINEAYFGEYLASAPVSLTETPIIHTYRLPQASWLQWTADAPVPRVERFWDPWSADERAISEGDARDELRHRLVAAVSVRTAAAGAGPVACQLSGGLDSSAVVGLAAQLTGTPPAAYSIVFPTVPMADERPFIDAVVARHRCALRTVPYAAGPVAGAGLFDAAIRAAALPEMTTGEYLMAPLLRAAAGDGHRIMLTGLGGDDWLTGSLFHVTDLVRRGRLAAAWRFARAYRTVPWLDPGAAVVCRSAIAPLLPTPVKRLARRYRRGLDAPWLTPAFIDRLDLATRMRATWDAVPPTRSHVVRESLARLWSGDLAHGRDAMHRIAQSAGVTLCHPFLDRRVVEFVLTLPDDLRLRGGQQRYLLRHACADVLPPVVRARNDKPVFDQVQVDAVRAADPDGMFAAPMQVVERGWVEPGAPESLWARVARLQFDRQDEESPEMFALWQILAAEAALRALSSRVA